MQPVDMGNQLRFTGPSAEVETKHFVRAFGGRASDPQTDQQAGDQGHIDLDPHAIGTLAEQMATTQHTFEPPEKQLHGPPIPIRQRDEVGVEVQPIRHQHHRRVPQDMRRDAPGRERRTPCSLTLAGDSAVERVQSLAVPAL